jgi:prepilin-type N-terminal cleavage/methylation domain-containing protein
VRRDARGFTLLELVLALAIVGVLVVIAFGGVRIALSAWRQGEDRAEAHQHVRSVALSLARSLNGVYPYTAPKAEAPTPVLLFEGKESRLEFVTQAPPYPASIPVAFTAVVFELGTSDEHRGLVIRQRVLPNREPFIEAKVVFNDPTLIALEFAYLDENGSWQDAWDSDQQKRLPRAVRITVGSSFGGRPQTLALTVPLRVGAEQ